MTGAITARGPAERGQATPEYVGLVLLVAAALAATLALAGPALPGGGLVRTLASALVCTVAGDDCDAAAVVLSPLEQAYGAELAVALLDHAPELFFEDDEFVSLPVDFRECRLRACSDSIRPGALRRTQTGLDPVAFTHVIDCRAPRQAGADGYDCSGERAGHLYLQYWLYYPDSATREYGRLGYHVDDWESFQIRIGPDGGTVARASSHRGYNGSSSGIGGALSDMGWRERAGWEEVLGALHVAAGSHAGLLGAGAGDSRRIRARDLELIPLESIAGGAGARFEVTPPWDKEVWRDPESRRT